MQKEGSTVQLGTVERVISKDKRNIPRRAFHSMLHHEGKLYMWGGASLEKYDPDTLFIFDFRAGEWKSFLLAADRVALTQLSGMCSAHCSNYWYFFGGVSAEGQLSNRLFRIWLPYCNSMEQVSQKGSVPPVSECGSLASMNGKWLLHYPGLTPSPTTAGSTLYALKISTMEWLQVISGFFDMRPRLSPGFCMVKEDIYIFGGVARDEDRMEHLSDFYQVRTISRDNSKKFYVMVNPISNIHGP